MQPKFPRRFRLAVLAGCLCLEAWAVPDLKFDIITFCCPCSVDDHVCQPQFDHLNWPTPNGHYLAMGSDARRYELATNGNALAIYYNTFNDGWPTNSGAQQAARIDQYASDRFTATGPKPDWVVLNEISTSRWQNDASYRAWVHDTVHALKSTYGYNVILYSPFATVAANSADWQAVATDAYIGVEHYLSGTEIKNQGFSVSWCQSQYQNSINTYTARGVPRAKLMLGEHFGQTTSGTGWGRSGVTSNEWDQAIVARSQAALNLAFTGYLSFAWGKNAMLVSDDELIHFEDTYRTNPLPANLGITAPFILIQPESQTAPPGADVAFLVFRTGNAPTSFQWRLNGTNLAGATGSALVLTNVQVTNQGNYSVVLSNAAGALTSSNALLTVTVPPPLAHEPFAPAVTAYAPGNNLIGQINSASQGWTQAGPDSGLANQPVVQAGNLTVGGLTAPAGNNVRFGGNGTSARFNIGSSSTSGTWFFSLVLRLANIAGLSPTGIFWVGFNNSSGSQTTTPTVVGTRVVARAATGGFQLGLDKNSGLTGNFVFAPTVFTTNDTVFLVGSYTFNDGSSTDDVSQLWINPPVGSFGLSAAPPATLTSTAGSDLSQLASFVLFNRHAQEPAIIFADELRIGTSWAGVTPPAWPGAPPALNITRSGTVAVLSWTTNAAGFVLEHAATLTGSNTWVTVAAPVHIVGSQFTVTNIIGDGNSFYRLRRPN